MEALLILLLALICRWRDGWTIPRERPKTDDWVEEGKLRW